MQVLAYLCLGATPSWLCLLPLVASLSRPLALEHLLVRFFMFQLGVNQPVQNFHFYQGLKVLITYEQIRTDSAPRNYQLRARNLIKNVMMNKEFAQLFPEQCSFFDLPER
jgi:hypothetical protein